MSITEISRFSWLTVALAIMLVFAGCTENVAVTEGRVGAADRVQTAGSSVSTSTDTETATPVQESMNSSSQDKQQSLSKYASQIGPAAANISEKQRSHVQDLVSNFYDELDLNESERREKFHDSADAICDFDRRFQSEVSVSAVEDSGEIGDDTVRRANYAAEIVNEWNGDVPIKPFREFDDKARDISKYAPLIGSYQQLSEKACIASRERTDAAIEKFQVVAVMFGVDTVLIVNGAFYRPAFAGTRFVTNKASQLGAYRLRYVCGDRCWALGMSKTHVALRGSMHTAVSNLLRKSQEMGIDLTRDDLEAVADSLDTDPSILLEQVDDSLVGKTLDTTKEELISCGKSILEGDGDSAATEEGGGLLDGGVSMNDVEEGWDDATESIDQCRPGHSD